MSNRRSRPRPRAVGHQVVPNAPQPSQDESPDEDGLLARLEEEREAARENERIWRAFREAPGWVTAVLLVLVTAVQLFVAANGNFEVATAIAGSIDTSRLFLLAAIAGIIIMGGVIPLYFSLYLRNELALRYRDIALTKASGDKLHDPRVLNRRMQGGLVWLISLIVISFAFSSAVLSVPVAILALLGLLNGVRSPFAPWNFWDRLRNQGYLNLPREKLK